MPVIVTVDLPDLAEAGGVLGLGPTPPALDSAAWRKLPAPAAAVRLLDDLGDARGDDDALVVVRPPGRVGLHLVLQSLAAVIGREKVVDVPLGRTPLSAAVTATFADVLARELEVPLGLVPELLRTVEQQLSIAALLTGVGRLETPQPRLLQQVAGYWPTTRAVVRRGRTDRVRVVGRKHSAAFLGRVLAPVDHRLVVSLPLSTPPWMHQVVSSRHDGSPTPVAVLTGDVRTGAHWGTERVVEAVGLPPRWRAVVRTAVEQLSERTCSWCAQRVNHVDACDLCSDSSLVAVAEGRGAARRPAPSATAAPSVGPAPAALPTTAPPTTAPKAPRRARSAPKSAPAGVGTAPSESPAQTPPRRTRTSRPAAEQQPAEVSESRPAPRRRTAAVRRAPAPVLDPTGGTRTAPAPVPDPAGGTGTLQDAGPTATADGAERGES